MTSQFAAFFLDARDAGVIDYRGVTGEGADTRFIVGLRGGVEKSLPEADGYAYWWLRGYRASAEAAGKRTGRRAKTAGRAAESRIRAILTDPTLADQLRLRLHAALQADKISLGDFATLTGHTQKTIGRAMRFSENLDAGRAEELLRALGRHWETGTDRTFPSGVTHWATGIEVDGVERALVTADPTPDFVRRWEHILRAVDAGWLVYAGPADPDDAKWPPRDARETKFEFVIGKQTEGVRARDLDAFLTGVADFHEGTTPA